MPLQKVVGVMAVVTAESISAVAAIGVARTYDPVVYDLLKVQGLQPDPAQALVWYERAKSAGAAEADAAIAALKQAGP